MNRERFQTEPLITWTAGGIRLEIDIDQDEHVYLRSIQPKNATASSWQPRDSTFSALPLTEVRLAGEGSQFSTSKREVQGYLAHRLRYVSHFESERGNERVLQVVTRDSQTEIIVTSRFSVFGDLPVLRSTVSVENTGTEAVLVQSVPSLVFGGLTLSTKTWWDDWHVHFAHNAWFREAQWHESSLPDIGLDCIGISESSRSSFSLSNQGSFSTGGHLPMGGLSLVNGRASYLWQIEHNGSWRWEIGDYEDGIFLNAGGPTDQDHSWFKELRPGQSFSGPPVALVTMPGDFNSAFGPLNSYRRLMRRQHKDNENLPVIFNDYMNCLMGDPTKEKVEALIEPAARAGAEIFVIDCGWYSDDDGWWETVGEWLPSRRRFPNGLKPTMDKIRTAGMIPGLWIEPEVMGVQCPAVKELPREAFFQRGGQRIIEGGRFQLDYRHLSVISRMNSIIDKLVTELGVGYFKFDYNIDVVQGTDISCSSPGDGLLEHNRAYLRWVNKLFDRHPSLVIENCSSGGQRMEYAMLGTHPLQSTSDQVDPVLYASIAAAAPTAVCPEQSATWAYPQPEWNDEINALTVVNSLMGRIHLSGNLVHLSRSQSELIAAGIATYKGMRQDIKVASPFWPLGLPKWSSPWHALGLDAQHCLFIAVWRTGFTRRDQKDGSLDDAKRDLMILRLKGKHVITRCVYPENLPSHSSWDSESGVLSITLPTAPSARVFKIESH